MNIFSETKRNYLIVTIIGFVVLSWLYWTFFYFDFYSSLIYILAAAFYITLYRVWIMLFEKKGHLIFFPVERFVIINLMVLAFVLTINSSKTINPLLISDLTCAYGVIFFLFLFWYAFRIQKQEKSFVEAAESTLTSKILTAMSVVFLLSDLIVSFFGNLSIQFVLYTPLLFLIFSFIISVCLKFFKLSSPFSLVLFFNIYIISLFLLVLNGINYNFFLVIVIIHFIVLSSTVFMIRANSIENKDLNSLCGFEDMALVFFNIVLIFISLNNFLYIKVPTIFVSYLYLVSIVILGYLGWKNYKMIKKTQSVF